MTKRKTFENIAFYLGNTLVALIFVSPLIWMISSSLKPESGIFKGLNSLSTFFPKGASFNNYIEVFQRINYVEIYWKQPVLCADYYCAGSSGEFHLRVCTGKI